MDDDRKYRQNGYMDSVREPRDFRRDDRTRPAGPRPPLDITGPRLPRLLQNVVASRCYNCSTMLPPDIEWNHAVCPKCSAALHCCKQCANFEPSTRFQCLKPIPVRIPVKDQANECELFKPRFTVARDAAPVTDRHASPSASVPSPRSASDARTAFDNLFKKPDE